MLSLRTIKLVGLSYSMSTFGIAFPSRNSKKSELLEMDLVIGPAVFVIVSTEFCALILWGPIAANKK